MQTLREVAKPKIQLFIGWTGAETVNAQPGEKTLFENKPGFHSSESPES